MRFCGIIVNFFAITTLGRRSPLNTVCVSVSLVQSSVCLSRREMPENPKSARDDALEERLAPHIWTPTRGLKNPEL